MKRYLVTAAILALLFGLSACGKKTAVPVESMEKTETGVNHEADSPSGSIEASGDTANSEEAANLKAAVSEEVVQQYIEYLNHEGYGEFKSLEQREYNAQNCLVWSLFNSGHGDTLTFQGYTEYTYDEENCLKKEEYYDADLCLLDYYEYQYGNDTASSYHNDCKKTHYSVEGEVLDQEEIQYAYIGAEIAAESSVNYRGTEDTVSVDWPWIFGLQVIEQTEFQLPYYSFTVPEDWVGTVAYYRPNVFSIEFYQIASLDTAGYMEGERIYPEYIRNNGYLGCICWYDNNMPIWDEDAESRRCSIFAGGTGFLHGITESNRCNQRILFHHGISGGVCLDHIRW